MGIARDNFYDHFRGGVDKAIVVKHYPDKIVITSFPGMSNVVPSEKQLLAKSNFALATKKGCGFTSFKV